MKNIFYAALLLFSHFLHSQITYENGYFIDKKGNKNNVLIKNYDWKNNPVEIEYKDNEEKKTSQIKTSDLLEFSVGGQKYVTATVMIDRSSKRIQNLSNSEKFEHIEETLLLKSIVDGQISLYEYSDGSIIRFFYKKEIENIFNPLDFKEYLTDDNLIRKNEEYKNQLRKEFSGHEKITTKDIERLSYNEAELKKIFVNYNNLDIEKVKLKNNFHIYIKPGIGISKYKIEESRDVYSQNESTIIPEYNMNSLLYRIGAEFEYIFNFNKGKWALISEPSFQTSKFKINNYKEKNFEIKYSSIQIPIGLKYNMFFSKKSKLYITASLYYQMILNKDTFKINDYSISADTRAYRSFSIGYNYDKFGIELKWGSVPHFTTNYYQGLYDMNMIGNNLSLSYKLF